MEGASELECSLAVMSGLSFPWLIVIAASLGRTQNITVCPSIEVRSILNAVDSSDLKTSAPEIRVEAGVGSAAPPPNSNVKLLSVIALGPILGSMDSNEVKTELTCTAKGVALTATITRSAGFKGSVLKNVLWRPKITLVVVSRETGTLFEAIWVMQLSTGIKLKHAQTPSQPDLRYPIRLRKDLAASPR